MQPLVGEQLRLLVGRLTKIGARVVWDGPDAVRSIALFGPRVTDQDLAGLRQMSGLREVNLTRTEITDGGMFHLRKLDQLETLFLGRTRVTDDGFELLASLVRLKNLNLISTAVTDAGLAALSGMTQLEALWLDSTDVTDATLERVAELTTLELLDVRNTLVTDSGLSHLTRLPRLKELNLSCCRNIAGPGWATLSQLTGLEWLGLDATSFDDQAAHYLQDLPLKSLSLNWNSVTAAALHRLERIETLVELDLLGAAVPEERLEAFRAARPDCRLRHSPPLQP